jgi:hypothetical protein
MFIASGLKSLKSQVITLPANSHARSPESPPASGAALGVAHLNIDILQPLPPAKVPSLLSPAQVKLKRRAYFHATHHQILELLKKHIESKKFKDYMQDLRRLPFKTRKSTELPSASDTQTDQGSTR